MGIPLPDLRDGLTKPARLILEHLHSQSRSHRFVKTGKLLVSVFDQDSTHALPELYAILLRLVRPWVCRYPLLQNQGHVGSIDGDPPPGMRYNEMRLQAFGEALLPFDGNGSLMTGPFPQLLCNGAWAHSGQVTTKLTEDAKASGPGDYGPIDYIPLDTWEGGSLLSFLPPHNLGEVARALIHVVDHPDAVLDDVLTILPAPDFPTGGQVTRDSVRKLYESGTGEVIVRSQAKTQQGLKGRKHLVITEVPFDTNKTQIIEQLAERVHAREYAWCSDIRDLSANEELRVEIEIRRGYDEAKLLLELMHRAPLEQSISFNLRVHSTRGESTEGLLSLLKAYLDHRRQVLGLKSDSDGQNAIRKELELLIPISDKRRTQVVGA